MSPQKPRDFGMLVSLASTVGLPPSDCTRIEVGVSDHRYTIIFHSTTNFLLPFPILIFIFYLLTYEYSVGVNIIGKTLHAKIVLEALTSSFKLAFSF